MKGQPQPVQCKKTCHEEGPMSGDAVSSENERVLCRSSGAGRGIGVFGRFLSNELKQVGGTKTERFSTELSLMWEWWQF